MQWQELKKPQWQSMGCQVCRSSRLRCHALCPKWRRHWWDTSWIRLMLCCWQCLNWNVVLRTKGRPRWNWGTDLRNRTQSNDAIYSLSSAAAMLTGIRSRPRWQTSWIICRWTIESAIWCEQDGSHIIVWSFRCSIRKGNWWYSYRFQATGRLSSDAHSRTP